MKTINSLHLLKTDWWRGQKPLCLQNLVIKINSQTVIETEDSQSVGDTYSRKFKITMQMTKYLIWLRRLKLKTI